jgi:beta-mannanase
MHDIFDAVGATNVTWVWSPNVVFSGSVPLEQLYPGDAYVDWTAIDGYNQSLKSPWISFSSLFSATYAKLLQIAPTKPIMIAETASSEAGGSKAAWITDALSTQLPQNFPRVKALVWFNWRIYEGSLWHDWPIESSVSAQAAFAAAIGAPYFAPGGGFGNLPLLTKIQPLP